MESSGVANESPPDDPKSPRHLSRAMSSKVFTLESENQRLRKEVSDLKEAYRAITSKNRLFQAKILELQARLLNPEKNAERYRSPFIIDEEGNLLYRFDRPQSARVESKSVSLSGPASGAPSSFREPANQPPPRSIVPRLPLSSRLSKPSSAISANATATDRVFNELDRIARPSPYAASLQRKLHVSARKPSSGADPRPPAETGAPPAPPAPAVEGLERLAADLECGRVRAGSHVQIRVAYCAAGEGRGVSVRHRPARYERAAVELQQVASEFHSDLSEFYNDRLRISQRLVRVF
jgi:hypothetical protein